MVVTVGLSVGSLRVGRRMPTSRSSLMRSGVVVQIGMMRRVRTGSRSPRLMVYEASASSLEGASAEGEEWEGGKEGEEGEGGGGKRG